MPIPSHATLIPTDFVENNQLLHALSFLNSPTGFLQSPSKPVQLESPTTFFLEATEVRLEAVRWLDPS